MKARIVLADVAKRAGVSVPTASRVLNNQGRFTNETRARVMMAVEELGFTPNLTARSLRLGRGDTVALLVGDIEQRFYAALTRQVQQAIEVQGLDLMLYDLAHSAERLTRFLDRAEALRLRGIVLASTERVSPESLARLRALQEQGVRVVALRQNLATAGIPSITQDDAAAGAVAARHLLAQGRGPMAFLGRITGSVVGAARHEGWRQAMDEAGQAVDERLVWDAAYRFSAGHQATARALREGLRFGGLVCSSDEMALGAMAALTDAGLSVPHDVAVVGFEQADWGAYTRPTLTTMSSDPAMIAEVLGALLDHTDPPRLDVPLRLMSMMLVRRQSA